MPKKDRAEFAVVHEARVKFLSRLVKLAPQVLDSLKKDVWPICERPREMAGAADDSQPTDQELVEAIGEWSAGYNINESWVHEAVLQTFELWTAMADKERDFLLPRLEIRWLEIEDFTFTHPRWDPSEMDWGTWRNKGVDFPVPPGVRRCASEGSRTVSARARDGV